MTGCVDATRLPCTSVNVAHVPCIAASFTVDVDSSLPLLLVLVTSHPNVYDDIISGNEKNTSTCVSKLRSTLPGVHAVAWIVIGYFLFSAHEIHMGILKAS